MIEAEQDFRRDHDLEDPRDWEEYCEEVGQEWLRSQGLVPSDPGPARIHPQPVAPDDEPLASVGPGSSDVPRQRRGPHRDLTPIEAPFYDALAETGLTFSVQTYIQHADQRYRLDFLVWYDGRCVAVELDGHEYHKTKEQRQDDARRDRWLNARGIRVIRFTGSEVYADADRCVRELLDVVRQSQARP